MSESSLSICETIEAQIRSEPGISIRTFAANFDTQALKALCRDEIDRIVFQSFIVNRIDLVEYIVRIIAEYKDIFLYISDQVIPDPSVITVTNTERRELVFILSETGLSFSISFSPLMRLVLWHYVHSLPLFVSYAKTTSPPGSTYLNVADNPHYLGLSFCNNDDITTLIPDPYFIRSNAYHDVKRKYAEQPLDWKNRINGAVWRGSTTGDATSRDIFDLPRVRLCLYAKQYEAVLDCGITSVVQDFGDRSEETLDKLGVFKPYLAAEEFQKWKIQIDIDGMTSSWPGLFTKLLSRSVVLKVDSPRGWKQWYYDRLVPWKHYIPIRSDFSDLKPIVDFLIENSECAERIARNAQQLAQSFTYEHEIALAIVAIERELLKNQSR